MTEYWLTGPTGEKALVQGDDERDRWFPHGWREGSEPRDGEFVWMDHPDDGIPKPGLVAWAARAYWQGIGWRPSAPPEPVNPAFDPVLNDNAARPRDEVPDGTVDDVLGWAGDDSARIERALVAERKRDKPRTTVVDALERRGQPKQDEAALTAQSNEG